MYIKAHFSQEEPAAGSHSPSLPLLHPPSPWGGSPAGVQLGPGGFTWGGPAMDSLLAVSHTLSFALPPGGSPPPLEGALGGPFTNLQFCFYLTS